MGKGDLKLGLDEIMKKEDIIGDKKTKEVFEKESKAADIEIRTAEGNTNEQKDTAVAHFRLERDLLENFEIYAKHVANSNVSEVTRTFVEQTVNTNRASIEKTKKWLNNKPKQ